MIVITITVLTILTTNEKNYKYFKQDCHRNCSISQITNGQLYCFFNFLNHKEGYGLSGHHHNFLRSDLDYMHF